MSKAELEKLMWLHYVAFAVNALLAFSLWVAAFFAPSLPGGAVVFSCGLVAYALADNQRQKGEVIAHTIEHLYPGGRA